MPINKNAFTLMEIMIVVVLIGVMAAFALPNYTKAVDKAHERDAYLQLMTINAANSIFKSQNSNAYWAGPATNDITAINAGLGISIIANDIVYTYSPITPLTYKVFADYPATGAIKCSLKVTEAGISKTVGSANPCACPTPVCRSSVGSTPVIPACTACP